MVAVQTTGCGPVVKAYQDGRDDVEVPWEPVETQIHGVRVPKPIGDRLILKVIYESSGFAVAVCDEDVAKARAEVAMEEGLHLCPEGALCYAAYMANLESGQVAPEDRVVLFNTASGLKSPMPPMERRLDCTKPIDYTAL
jgi:threonine synthase